MIKSRGCALEHVESSVIKAFMSGSIVHKLCEGGRGRRATRIDTDEFEGVFPLFTESGQPDYKDLRHAGSLILELITTESNI